MNKFFRASVTKDVWKYETIKSTQKTDTVKRTAQTSRLREFNEPSFIVPKFYSYILPENHSDDETVD